MASVESSASKGKSAAFALATGWESAMQSDNENFMNCLSEMRKTAIDAICEAKYADDSVYDSLEKSYINNFISINPDFDEIKKTLNALASINTDKSVNLLFIFLQGLHQKKSANNWSAKEDQIFPWVVGSLGITKRKIRNLWNLLVVIYKSEKYSVKDRLCARDALKSIKED